MSEDLAAAIAILDARDLARQTDVVEHLAHCDKPIAACQICSAAYELVPAP